MHTLPIGGGRTDNLVFTMIMRILKSLSIWFLILPCAIANGGLREMALRPILGTTAAYLTSGVLLALIILGIALGSLRWLDIRDRTTALGTGSQWLLLTLGFEFGFGHFVQGRPWAELWEAYTFKGGNLWPLILLLTWFAPLIALHARGAQSASTRSRRP